MPKRRSGLNALFDALNQKYFEGRLPRYRVKRVSRMPHPVLRGCCVFDSRTIKLIRTLKDDECREVLLHEMIHTRTRGHGVRFQAELARLAKMGEGWAEKQRALYEEACHHKDPPPTVTIRHQIGTLADAHPELRWPEVLRILAQAVDRSPREVLRIAPWANQVWHRELVYGQQQDRWLNSLKKEVPASADPSAHTAISGSSPSSDTVATDEGETEGTM